jgi:hypothetical protein
MDTSQLMNHVVHRQLCYTFFTQVPIEPFFQLGLDFLFAGSYFKANGNGAFIKHGMLQRWVPYSNKKIIKPF